MGTHTVTSPTSSKLLPGDRQPLALLTSIARVAEGDGGSTVTMEAQWSGGQQHEL